MFPLKFYFHHELSRIRVRCRRGQGISLRQICAMARPVKRNRYSADDLRSRAIPKIYLFSRSANYPKAQVLLGVTPWTGAVLGKYSRMPTKKKRIPITLESDELLLVSRKAELYNMPVATYCGYIVRRYLRYNLNDPLLELGSLGQMELDFD